MADGCAVEAGIASRCARGRRPPAAGGASELHEATTDDGGTARNPDWR